MDIREFCCSVAAQSCLILCDPMNCSTPGFPAFIISQSLLKLMSTELVMPSNHLILCRPLLLLPSIFPSIRVFFKWVSSLQQVVKVLELQLQHQSFQWTFRVDFLQDWLVWSPCRPKEGLWSLLQHHSSKASILQLSAFLMVQLSHSYNYWKNHSFDYTKLCWQNDFSAF